LEARIYSNHIFLSISVKHKINISELNMVTRQGSLKSATQFTEPATRITEPATRITEPDLTDLVQKKEWKNISNQNV